MCFYVQYGRPKIKIKKEAKFSGYNDITILQKHNTSCGGGAPFFFISEALPRARGQKADLKPWDARYDRGAPLFFLTLPLTLLEGLTPLPLETRFWGQHYLDLV